MNNEVWVKAAQFFKELRCENTGRSSYLTLPEYKKALEEKVVRYKDYEDVVAKVEKKDRDKIQKYMDSIENCAEEENQQAYLQGIVDSMLILSGMKILEPEERIIDMIKYLE